MRNTPRIFKHEQAKNDLAEIFGYLLERNEKIARLFLVESREAFDLILRFPGIRQRWDSPAALIRGLRFTTLSRRFHNYLVFYRSVPDGVQVVTVIHGSRDFGRTVDELPDDFSQD